MTWRYAVTEFNWKTSWSLESGFEIKTFDYLTDADIKLRDISTEIIDGIMVDKIDYVFKTDEDLIGTWQSVWSGDDPLDFKAFTNLYVSDLYIQNIAFYKDGSTSGFWKWTNGLITHSGDKTAERYFIHTINEVEYLFVENKTGDYILIMQNLLCMLTSEMR